MFKRTKWKQLIGVSFILIFIWMASHYFDYQSLKDLTLFVVKHPFLMIWMFSLYFLAFLLRAIAWYVYVERNISFRYCLSGIFYSMFMNHLLPFKGGDLVRIGVATLEPKRKLTIGETVHSVVVMRILDVGMLFVVTAIGFSRWIGEIPFPFISQHIILLGVLVLMIVGFAVRRWLWHRVKEQLTMLKRGLRGLKGVFVLTTIGLSWGMEATLIFYFLSGQPFSISFIEAIWVNSLTVGGQFFQVTPGGIATYEAMMTFGLKAVHVPSSSAFSAAIMTHLFKFIFSFIVGYIAFLLVPLKKERIQQFLKREKMNL